jgi:ABC-type transporter Mla subunit MlaD
MSDIPIPQGRFRGLVLKVNFFLLLALALAGGFMALVAYKQGWFIQQTPIHFLTANALGINKGMPVKLYGLTIGSVTDLNLAATGVDVTLSITSEHLTRIPEGSHARHIRESGVIGASVIDIVPGKSNRMLDRGAYITFEPSRGISEIIDDFRRQAVPAFNELRQVLGQVGRSGEDMAEILAALRTEIDKLPETHQSVRKLLDQGQATLSSADRTLGSAERAAQGAERIAASLDRSLPALVQSIDAAAIQLRKTGEEAQLTLKSTRPIIDQGEAAARDAGDVLNAAKRVWPLSDAFKDSSDPMLPIDSFEGQRKR